MSYIFSYNCSFWSCSACLQLNHLWTCGRLPESWLFYLLKAECSFSCRAQIQLLLGRGGGGRRFPGSVILTRAWVELKIVVDRWRMCWPGTWVWALSRAQGACLKEMTWPEARKMSVWVAHPPRWLSHPPDDWSNSRAVTASVQAKLERSMPDWVKLFTQELQD